MPSEFLQTTGWVLEQSTMKIVDEVLTAKMNGQDRDLTAIEASLGKPMSSSRPDKPYTVEDGVAVISMNGLMGKRMNLMTRMSGGVSTQFMQMALEDALTDPAVTAVVVSVDSPGGTVDGTAELCDWLLSVRGVKPVFSYVDGMMASGAYWFGSATDEIWGYRTASVGSVSVVVCHFDRSGADAKAGIKRKFITSGKYKRMANDAEPLSEDGEAYLQDRVDRYHAMFIDGVAAGRGIEPDAAQTKFGDGKVHLAAQALAIGMIDHIGSLAETIDAARAAAQEGRSMNKAEILNKFPGPAAELQAEGKAAAEAEFEGQVQEQGDSLVAAEQERMVGLYGAIHGEEAKVGFKTLVETDVNGAQLAALAGVGFGAKTKQTDAGGDSINEKILTKLENEDETDLKTNSQGDGSTDFMSAVKTYAKEHGVGNIAAMKAVRKEQPDLHKSFLKKSAS